MIEVGSKVRCVNPSPARWTKLEEGKVYTVKDSFRGNEGKEGVRLTEVAGKFFADRFELAEAK